MNTATILRNWKTSAAGLAVLALTIALLMGKIDATQFGAALGVVTAGGLAVAQDGRPNSQDGPRQQP